MTVRTVQTHLLISIHLHITPSPHFSSTIIHSFILSTSPSNAPLLPSLSQNYAPILTPLTTRLRKTLASLPFPHLPLTPHPRHISKRHELTAHPPKRHAIGPQHDFFTNAINAGFASLTEGAARAVETISVATDTRIVENFIFDWREKRSGKDGWMDG